MAIKIQALENISKTYKDKTYVYKDLTLDLTTTKIDSPGVSLPVPGSDIKASFDLAAINNSLTNLFNTLPGQRFLFPEYGLNLYQFLFEPVTPENGELIGDAVFRAVTTFEPRITVKNINISVDADNNQYYVTAIIQLPILNLIEELDFVFNIKKQSFISLPVQRRK
jgi:phage baseplate assembly protein W